MPHRNHINPHSGGRQHSQKTMGGLTFGFLLLGGQKRERDGEAAAQRQPVPALYGTQFVHQFRQVGCLGFFLFSLGKTNPSSNVHQQVVPGSDVSASQLSSLPKLHT